MKIAINGDIIDTENIYMITKIMTPYFGHKYGFTIRLFGDNVIRVGIGVSYQDKITYSRMKELIILYRKIIKIWSENQSKIPQFNIE